MTVLPPRSTPPSNEPAVVPEPPRSPVAWTGSHPWLVQARGTRIGRAVVAVGVGAVVLAVIGAADLDRWAIDQPAGPVADAAVALAGTWRGLAEPVGGLRLAEAIRSVLAEARDARFGESAP